MIFVELAILLACIVVGARLGGIGLGTMGGVGLAIFVFVFGMPPGSPPAGTDKLTIRDVHVRANDNRQVAVAYFQDAKARCLKSR